MAMRARVSLQHSVALHGRVYELSGVFRVESPHSNSTNSSGSSGSGKRVPAVAAEVEASWSHRTPVLIPSTGFLAIAALPYALCPMPYALYPGGFLAIAALRRYRATHAAPSRHRSTQQPPA